MIERDLAPRLLRAAQATPAVTLTGPRQSGKTTLCRHLFPEHPYVTLENPDVGVLARDDPRAFLARFPDGAVIDEIQRAPDLLSYLQGIVDDDPTPGRWILAGSQNLALLDSVGQSLAGRTTIHHLLPLTRREALRFGNPPATLDEILFAGGYPRIPERGLSPTEWLPSYVAAYVERDVRSVSNVGDLPTFRRFLTLCAGRTAQTLNYSSLAKDCGITQPTAKAWLGILEASFLVFSLPVFYGNLRKRLAKTPKLHFYDTGLVCSLLGIRSPRELDAHPLRGPIFETWVVSEIVKHRINQGETGRLSFYRDRSGTEVDLVVERPTSVTLVEAKSAMTAPSNPFTGAERVRRDLAEAAPSCSAIVVYGGDRTQRRTGGELISWADLHERDWAHPDSVGVVRSGGEPAASSGPEPAVQTGARVVVTRSGGEPVVGADVLLLFPNGTRRPAKTDGNGHAIVDLYDLHEPMTAFVAAVGHAAHVEREWTPAAETLNVELTALPDGGAVIFPDVLGYIPDLEGRLQVNRYDTGQTCIIAKNIAINGKVRNSFCFRIGADLHLKDSNGSTVVLRVIDIVGVSVLAEYRRV